MRQDAGRRGIGGIGTEVDIGFVQQQQGVWRQCRTQGADVFCLPVVAGGIIRVGQIQHRGMLGAGYFRQPCQVGLQVLTALAIRHFQHAGPYPFGKVAEGGISASGGDDGIARIAGQAQCQQDQAVSTGVEQHFIRAHAIESCRALAQGMRVRVRIQSGHFRQGLAQFTGQRRYRVGQAFIRADTGLDAVAQRRFQLHDAGKRVDDGVVFQMAGKTGHGRFSSFGQPILDVFIRWTNQLVC